LTRIIRILDEELTELMIAGLYRQAEETRKRLDTYIDMRNSQERNTDDRQRT